MVLRARWLLLGLAALVLVAHSLAYNFVTDDAYISFVYSRNLAEHGELAFNLGQPVEGYTNFLWTLVLGLLMVVGVPPELSSRVLGTACGLATLWVVFRLVERALERPTPWAAVPALLLACSSGFACWTSGGLETQLFTLLVVAALEAVVAAATQPHAIRRAGWLLALAAMTRPEAPVIAVLFGVAHLVTRQRGGWRDVLVACAWFAGVWGPWFAWRWWYYGYPFPNTYYVKASGPWAGAHLAGQMLENGLHYLWVWLVQTRLLYALPVAALGFVARPRRSPRFALVLGMGLLAAFYVPYTISVGGDFMGLHRFIMPLFVVAAVAVTLGLAWMLAHVPEPRRQVATLVAVALVVGAFAVTQLMLTRQSLRWGNFDSDRGIDTPAFLIAYTEDRAQIGRATAGCFRDDDFSIVGGAGAQPYYARMRGVDVFGLVSDRIAHQAPRIRARAGHTKFGDDRLLATYDPTFVLSCYRLHRTPEQPVLPCAGFWLARGYEHVTIHVPGLREQGEYYTFLAKKARAFSCPVRVR
jgi:arabinofuranosyltransferase